MHTYIHAYRSCSHWWLKGLKYLLHCTQPLTQWRSLKFTNKRGSTLNELGVWGCVMGGILASKMAR